MGYDPRNNDERFNDYYEEEVVEEEDNEQFVLTTVGTKILERHNVSVDELRTFCRWIRGQHTSIPCIPEMSASVSEYMVSASKTCNILNPTAANIEYSYDIDGKTKENDDDPMEKEKYRVFFTAFIDEEGEDDINMYQWLTSLQKLKINLTEQQIVGGFKYMIQQNEDSEGYIDFVDFTNFCQLDIADEDVKRT